MKERAAIIIVSYNGSRYIKNCLASIFNNDYPEFAIYVVDNNSSDDTVSIIENEFPRVRLLKSAENLGFAGGNNLGIKVALESGCDYIILLNQDTEVEAGWLENLVSAARENKEAGIIQSLLVLHAERDKLNNLGNALHFLGFGFVRNYRDNVDKYRSRPAFCIDGYASGAAMLIKREVLKKLNPLLSKEGVGGGCAAFDEKFFAYMEDLDLCWRARLAGYKIMLAPQSAVYHHYQFNKDKNNFFYWNERNRLAVLLQNYSVLTLLLLSPALAIIELLTLVYSLAGGWIGQKIRSYLWVWLNLPAIWRLRRAVQSRRVVSDKKIMQNADWRLMIPGNENLILKFIINPILHLFYRIICQLV